MATEGSRHGRMGVHNYRDQASQLAVQPASMYVQMKH